MFNTEDFDGDSELRKRMRRVIFWERMHKLFFLINRTAH